MGAGPVRPAGPTASGVSARATAGGRGDAVAAGVVAVAVAVAAAAAVVGGVSRVDGAATAGGPPAWASGRATAWFESGVVGTAVSEGIPGASRVGISPPDNWGSPGIGVDGPPAAASVPAAGMSPAPAVVTTG